MLFFKKEEIINDRGFTIMEAMVTVGIIAIMSAVYLINYRQTNQKIILDQAAAGVVADLRYAQNMAMNVKKFNGEIPCGGYGIKIDSVATTPATSYIIFADKDDGSNPLLCVSDKSYTAALAEKVSDRALYSNVKIISPSLENIVFMPPSPVVFINGVSGVALSTITLRYGGAGGPARTITINGYTGQISVSN